MKVFLVYMISQFLIIVTFLCMSIYVYGHNKFGGFIILLFTVFESLKLCHDWDGESPPENYDQDHEILKIITVKFSFLSLFILASFFILNTPYTFHKMLGMLVVVMGVFLSDLNIKFYKNEPKRN